MAVYMEIRIASLVQEWLNSMPEDERPSQNQIAGMAGINPGTLSHYMQGKAQRPDPNVIAKICKVIGVDDMNMVFVVSEGGHNE